MKSWDRIKKQIEEQTRPDLGHIPNMRTQGFALRAEPKPQEVGPPIYLTWNKTYYSFNRGSTFVHTPQSFLEYVGPRRSAHAWSDLGGEFIDSGVNLYDNCHYAVMVKSPNNCHVRVGLGSYNCSMSLYLREGGSDYLLVASQAVASPSEVTLFFRANVWTEIHLYTYHGATEDQVRGFGGLTSALSQAAELDIYPPGPPSWREPAITTELLDPSTGQSQVTLYWELPSEPDWAGNSIYRVESYRENQIFTIPPSGIFTPPEFATTTGIGMITISGDQASKYMAGSEIAISGFDLKIIKSVFQPANLFPNNSFQNTNSSGYPLGWQVAKGGAATFAVATGGEFSTKEVVVNIPSGTASISYMTTSGFIPVDASQIYNLSIYSSPVTTGMAAYVRVQFYDLGYNTQAQNKVDLNIDNASAATSLYRMRIGPATATGLDGYFASGCAYVKATLYFAKTPASGFAGSYSAIRLAQENTFGGYGSEEVDTTRLFMVADSGLPRLSLGDYVDRRTYFHIFDRARQQSDYNRGFIYWIDSAVCFGREYSYTIDTYDNSGNHSDLGESRTITAGDLVPPAHVSGIGVHRTNAATGSISWTNPPDEDFVAAVVCTGTGRDEVAVVQGRPSQRSYFGFNNLSAGQTLLVTLFAMDRNGNRNASEPVPSGIIPSDWDSDEEIFAINLDKQWYKAGSNYPINILSQSAIASNTPNITVIDSTRESIYKAGSLAKSDSFKWMAQFNISGAGAASATEGVAHVVADVITDAGKHIQAHATFGIDITAPVISSFNIVSNNGITETDMVIVNISAGDNVSGLSEMILSESANFSGVDWMPFATQYTFKFRNLQTGNKTLNLKVRDRALNESAVCQASVYMDRSGQQNYLFNSSFEYRTINSGIPDGWLWENGGGGFGPYVYSGVAPMGDYCIDADNTWRFFCEKVYLPPKFWERDYFLSWYSQSSKGFPVWLLMDFYDSSGRQIGTTLSGGNGLLGVGDNSKSWDRFVHKIESSGLITYSGASYFRMYVSSDNGRAPADRPLVDAIQFQASQYSNFYELVNDDADNIGSGKLRGFQLGDNEIGPDQITGMAPKDTYAGGISDGRSFFNSGGLEYLDPAGIGYSPSPYMKGIFYISPNDLICGSRQYFESFGLHFTYAPQVVLIPARVMTYWSGTKDPHSNMFLDLSNYEVTAGFLKVKSVLRYGSTNNLEYTYTVLSGSPLISGSDLSLTYDPYNFSITKSAADVLVFSSGVWNRTTKLRVAIEFTAPLVTDLMHPSGYPCEMDFCLFTNPATGVNQWVQGANTQSGYQSVRFRTDGQIYNQYLEIDRTTPSGYGIKIDWMSRWPDDDAFHPQTVWVTKVMHMAAGDGIEITGSGICGALILYS